MRISDWSSDVCSSDLAMYRERRRNPGFAARWHEALCEGFARLEAELLAEALIAPTGNVKDATLKSRAQKYRLGLSLMAAHRAAVRGARLPLGGAAPTRDRTRVVSGKSVSVRVDHGGRR